MQRLSVLVSAAALALAIIIGSALLFRSGDQDPQPQVVTQNATNSEPRMHTVKGAVGIVDRERGMVNVDVNRDELRLQLPVQVVQNLSDGDIITAHLSFTRMVDVGTTDAPAQVVAGDAPLPMGNSTGTIKKIDHARGIFELATDSDTLRLAFPPATIRELNVGDVIVLHAVVDTPTS